MSRYVTLGGKRLGAGNQMKQRLPEHSRSTHNLSHTVTTSMAPGLLVPCLTQVVLPNDTWKIKVNALIFTKPTLGPMFGTFKFEVHGFYAPFRLYNGALHNNTLGIGMEMQNVRFSQIMFNTFKVANSVILSGEDPDEMYMSSSSLNAYMGYGKLPTVAKVGNITTANLPRFATHYLMYADIFKNAYANKQETNAYVMGAKQLETTVSSCMLNESRGMGTNIPILSQSGNQRGKATPIYIGAWKVESGGDVFAGDVVNQTAITNRITLRGRNLSEKIKFKFFKTDVAQSNPDTPFPNAQTATVTLEIKDFAVPGSIVLNEQNNLEFLVTRESLMAAAHKGTREKAGDGWTNGLFVAMDNNPNLSSNVTHTWGGFMFIAPEKRTLLDEYEPQIELFPLANIDKMRKQILSNNEGLSMNIKPTKEEPAGGNSIDYLPLSINADRWAFNSTADFKAKTPLVGLLLKTYQADIFNAYLSNAFLEKSESGWGKRISVDTSEGYFMIDSLLLSEKYYNLYNTILMQGGTYKDWRKAMWSVEDIGGIETPLFIGGMSTEIYFQEVNATAGSERNALGSIAGRGTSGGRKGGYITLKPKEEGLLMMIASITPRIAYTQGQPWYADLQNMQQLHTAELDRIGFEALLQKQQAGWAMMDVAVGQGWQNPTTGKVPAWIWYQTEYDKVYGELAEKTKQNYMVLTRNYERVGLIGANGTPEALIIDDNTTYIDPSKYNNCFAEASLTAQNFWVQIKFEIEARREMSANLIPRT